MAVGKTPKEARRRRREYVNVMAEVFQVGGCERLGNLEPASDI